MEFNGINLSNEKKFTLFGGLNVLEDLDSTLHAVNEFLSATSKLDIPFVFKASWDKANRSSIESYRGVGLDKGMEIFSLLKKEFNVPLITDVHEIDQVPIVSEVVDVIQIPAFLSRQTDFVLKVAKSYKPVNIKKPQFMSPQQVKHIVKKCNDTGNDKIIVCERGTSFGYDNLIVDMLGFKAMKDATNNAPIIFDVTHSLQCRDPLGQSSGGRRQQLVELARAGMATRIAGLFLEAHVDPDSAKCDGPSALPMNLLRPFLEQVKAVDDVVKALPDLKIY
ncbi:MAG: 3-deoxy-8-phosphooctulonate synthase [Zetaproteobacteria bacterium]|nr:3-deoxy-8-phosphooctulonate synthase [Pseudobdellovibrionaceae bacterium]